jgi:hypothetical protein
MVDVPLSAPNAHFGVLKKMFQVRAGHQAAYPPTSTLGPFFCPWIDLAPRLVVKDSRPAKTLQ